jgi:hypothetical protein
MTQMSFDVLRAFAPSSGREFVKLGMNSEKIKFNGRSELL